MKNIKGKKNYKKVSPYSEPADFMFEKAPKPNFNINRRLNDKIGTPVHIGYLSMSKGDSRRDKRRCKYIYKEKNLYLCGCGGGMKCISATNCSLYKEKDFSKKSTVNRNIPILYRVFEKRMICPYCQARLLNKKIDIEVHSKDFRNKYVKIKTFDLQICKSCKKNFVLEEDYNSYNNYKKLYKVEHINFSRKCI